MEQTQKRRQRRTLKSKEYTDFVCKNIETVGRTRATYNPNIVVEVNKLDLQKKLLAPEELQCFWEEEFDRQMRKAALLDEEQWHAQHMLHDMKTMKLSTEKRRSLAGPKAIELGKDEDAVNFKDMADDKRADYEEEIRESIVKEIDKFLTEESIEEELKNFKAELPIDQLAGAKPHVKCALFVAKMCNKFNAVSNRIISSYNWELSRTKIAPEDPVVYRKMLQEELHLSPAELVF